MRIVVTVPWGERLGGAENMLWTFLRQASRTHLELIVVFLQPGTFEQEVAALGIRTRVLPAGRLRNVRRALSVVLSLAALLRQEKPDLLVNWMAKTHVYGAAAALLARRASHMVWWQHGIPNGHWLDRLATLLPARAVGCSSARSAEAQRLQWPHRNTFVVHPGLEQPILPRDEELASLRRELAIPQGRTVVGIVGRLEPGKGHHRLLRAIGNLRDRGRDIHGLVVGGNAWDLSPGYEQSLHELTDELGLAGCVTFAGQVPDASPYVLLMDVLVNPSAKESFGMVLIEAMALGVPVVGIRSAGPMEIIEPDRSGVLAADGEPDTLADAIDRLIKDDELRTLLVAGGRRRFSTAFTANRMADELEQRLQEVRGADR